MEEIDNCVDILESVWTQINFDNIKDRRNIYNEFRDWIEESTDVRTLNEFLERLCENAGVRSIADTKIIEIIEDKSKHKDLLKLFREQSQFLVLKLRQRRGKL